MRSKQDRRRFASAGRSLHAATPEYVPPLDSAVRSYLNPRVNPFFGEAQIDHFLAVDGRRVLGRISTTIEQRYTDAHGAVGWFGWFDCVNDKEVAKGLLDVAEEWLRARGMPRIEGPYSYNATQEFGLLTSGFDQVPALTQPHHEPYYDALLQAFGYRPRYHTKTYTWTSADRAVLEPVSERGRRTRQLKGLSVRSLDTRRWAADVECVWQLFLRTFSQQHDMIPMTRTVFDWQLSDLKQFVDPDLVRFVELDGKPIGFSFLVADANEVLAAAGGRAGPVFLLRYPWLRRKVRGAVVLMVGVIPGKEHTGAGRVLAGEIADVALGRVGRYDRVHTSWIHEENESSLALVNRTGAEPRRVYAVYGKDL